VVRWQLFLGRFRPLAGANLTSSAARSSGPRPHGAGKTTLLRVLAGLVAVSAGEAVVLGCDLRARRQDVRTKVGSSHGNGLYEDLTAAENVRFWGRTVGATEAEIATAMARSAWPAAWPRCPCTACRRGQRRRTALAVVAAAGPSCGCRRAHAGLDAAGRDLLDALLGEAVGGGATVVSPPTSRPGRAPGPRVVTMAGGIVEAPTLDAAPVPC